MGSSAAFARVHPYISVYLEPSVHINLSVRLIMKFPNALVLAVALAGASAKMQFGPIAEYNHNNPRAGCDPDYGWLDGVDGSGKCYMLVKNLDFSTCYSSDVTGYGMDWFDAMECCYYNGGYLAEPVNQEEQALLEKYIVAADGGGGFALSAYWLGGNDMHHENGWIWPSGSPMTYTNWVEGEPSGEDLQDCMAIDSPKEHKWMDLDCSQAQHANVLHFAACEKIPGA